MIKPILEEDPLSEKEKKKQKREKIFAAISDGISALSNLYFTTQYAPNMYTGKNTQSQATRERWEKLIKERKEDRNTRLEWMYKAWQADNANNQKEREWKRQLGIDEVKVARDKAADERAAAKEEREQALHPFAVRKAEGDAKAAEAKAQYAAEYEQSRIGRNKAAAGASAATASASRARAGYYAGGGSSGNRYYGELRGKKYTTKADYEKAVMDAAKANGVAITEEVTEKNGYNTKTKRVNRPVSEIAAELEYMFREGYDDNGDGYDGPPEEDFGGNFGKKKIKGFGSN